MFQPKAKERGVQPAVFTEGHIGKSLIRFAIPLFGGNILQQFYNIADSIIVGNILGPAALAAVGASTPINRLFISVAIGITLGVAVLVSQNLGANDKEAVRLTISTSYLFFAVLSVCLLVPGLLLSRQLLQIFKTPAEILDDATVFLRITFVGVIPMIGHNVSYSIYRGFGDSKVPLAMLVISTLLNVVLDLIALLVLRTGVAGIAWATVVSQFVAFSFAALLFKRRHVGYGISLKQRLFSGALLQKCLKIGIPSGIKGSVYWGGAALLTSVVNSYGTAAVAAFSIASRIDAFIQTPLVSLQNSLAAFVGQNVGAKKQGRIKEGVKFSLFIGLVFSLSLSAAVYLFAPRGLLLFTQDPQVVEIGAQYLRIVCIFYAVYSIQEVIQGLAIGFGDTWILLLSTVVAMWAVRLPLTYFLSSRMGMQGIWWSMPSGWFIAMVFTCGYYFWGSWKKRLM